jgi:hypothetical protein
LKFQDSDRHTRETDAHIEEESSEWEHLFRLTTPIFVVAESIVGWCLKSKTLWHNVIR